MLFDDVHKSLVYVPTLCLALPPLVQDSDLQIHIVSCIVIVGSGGGSLPAGPFSDIRQHAAVAPPPSPAIDNIAVDRAVAGNLDSTHTGFRSSSCPRKPTLPACRRVVELAACDRHAVNSCTKFSIFVYES